MFFVLRKIFHNRVIFVLIALAISVGLSFSGFSNSFFITEKINPNTFFSPLIISLIVLLVDSILITVIFYQKENYLLTKSDINLRNSIRKPHFTGGIWYLLLLGGGGLTVFVIRFLYSYVDFDFKVNSLFDIGYRDIFWFFIFINIFISYLLFSLSIYVEIDKLKLKLNEKLVIIGVIISLFIVSSLAFRWSYSIPVLLSFLIFIFVLDLYMDKKSLSSTWIFTFMILIAGFTALILFSAYSELRTSKRIMTINNSIFVPNERAKGLISENKIDTIGLKANNIIIDTIGEKHFLDIINNGYYNLSNSLYFNPRTGNYIRLIAKSDDKGQYVVKYLSNKSSVKTEPSIIFYDNRLLSNNTSYDKIPIEDGFLSDTAKIKEYYADGLSFLKYKMDTNLTVISIEKVPGILIPFSLFSMLFVLTGIFVFLISIINSRFEILPDIIGVSFNGVNSLRDRIQFSIIGMVVVSFFILGLITFYFIDKNSIPQASQILSNFLNVYVLLFLVAGAIAIALANSISKPVEILGEKLEILDLSENNELLKWDKQDEIGRLIEIYNRTVKKLEESAKIISKIERDSAWREMAKQVAHEIKNPLTPLKLNIQYMQGVVSNTPERAADMVKQLAPGLIEQINNLDKIATEFADFAKMPKASNEKVRLNEIVKAVHDFFRKREDLDIQLYVPINDLIIFADKNHLVSILNNILKNAIQAIPTDKVGKIVIELYKKNNDAIVKITDNGTGIPDEMLSKVFSPNFTTKNSGTGLGLAISTNMIQAFNGKIYFETEVGKGTSFFVEIPLMRIQDNYPEQKRVFLDD